MAQKAFGTIRDSFKDAALDGKADTIASDVQMRRKLGLSEYHIDFTTNGHVLRAFIPLYLVKDDFNKRVGTHVNFEHVRSPHAINVVSEFIFTP